MDIWTTPMCTNLYCTFRHPKVCKYFTNVRRCKFEESCAYLHGPEQRVDEKKISELEQEIENLNAKIAEIDAILLKPAQIESRSSYVEESNFRNNEEIEKVKNKLVLKTSQLEEVKKVLDQKSSQHDELAQNFYILMNAVDDLEKSSAQLKHHLNNLSQQIQTFQCNLCGQAF